MKNSLKCRSSLIINRMIILSSLCFMSLEFPAQATNSDPLNQPGVGPHFLGWDPSVNSDVVIRHRTENQPIIFSTD